MIGKHHEIYIPIIKKYSFTGLTKTFWLEDRLNVCNVRITEDTIN